MFYNINVIWKTEKTDVLKFAVSSVVVDFH